MLNINHHCSAKKPHQNQSGLPGRPAVALRTVLKTDRRHIADVSPEVVYRGDSVDTLAAVRDTLAAVRAVRTADLVVDELTGVRGARRGTVDEQSEVDRLVRRDGAVEETVVEAVLVARARLADCLLYTSDAADE